jgi:hypothetical protein
MKFQRLLVLSGCVLVYPCLGMDAPSAPVAAAPSAEPVSSTEWSSYAAQTAGVDEGRGDWFKKRKILQLARKSYQDISKQVQEIQATVQQFMQAQEPAILERTKVLEGLGIQEGIINKAETDLVEQIQQNAAQQDRSEANRQELIDLNDSKKLLDTFKEDVLYLFELQRGMVQAISLLKAQVDRCIAYEKNAWKLYELIDAALNDKIAQQMFDEMQTTLENIGLIRSYIENDLKKYTETTIQSFDAQRKVVEDAHQVLMKRAVFVDKNAQQDLIKTPTSSASTSKASEAEPTSWWYWPLYPFVWLWSLIARLWR